MMRAFLEGIGFIKFLLACTGVAALVVCWLEDRIDAAILDPMDPKNISADIRELAERVDTLLDWANDAADYAERNGIDDAEANRACAVLEEIGYKLRESAREVGAL